MQNTDVTHYSVAVLAGGWSDERDISMQSGTECTKALQEAGFRHVELFDVKDLSFVSRLAAREFDVVFVAMHGKFGEDGCIQGLLETLHIPYTGSGVLASALSMHKNMAKFVYRSANIPAPRDIYVPSHQVIDDELVQHITHELRLPYVVKPTDNGSSFGVHLVNDAATLASAIASARGKNSGVLVEERIIGTEITVPVIGTKNPHALPVVEIRYEAPIYDLDAKNEPAALHHVIPANLSPAAYSRAQELAVRAHRALGCTGVSRSDFIVDATGEPYILETNNIPGMTVHSLIPDAARHDGMSFSELCTYLIECACEDHEDYLHYHE